MLSLCPTNDVSQFLAICENHISRKMKLVIACFVACASCVVLRVILLAYVMAAASSKAGIPRWESNSAAMCRELDMLVPIVCAAALIFWWRLIWASGGSISRRFGRCFGAFIICAAFFVAIALGMYGLAIF